MFLSSEDMLDADLCCKSDHSGSPPTTFSIDSILSQKMLHQAERNRLNDLTLVTYDSSKTPKTHHTEQVMKYRSGGDKLIGNKYSSPERPHSIDLNNNNSNQSANDIEFELRKEDVNNNDTLASNVGIKHYRDNRETCQCDSCYPTKSKNRCKVTTWVYSEADLGRTNYRDECYYSDRRYCDSRTSMHNYYDGGLSSSYARSSDGEDKNMSKRRRTIFTASQLERLEFEFQQQQYIVGQERRYLARELGLNEIQVKVWFQNRRIKWRKFSHTHDIETVLVASN